MNRYELKGTIKDTRKLTGFITTTLLQQLEKEDNYIIDEYPGVQMIRFVGPLYFITDELNKTIVDMINKESERTPFTERVRNAVKHFCQQTLRLIISYVEEDVSGKWYSPLLLWKVIEDYYTSKNVNRLALTQAVTVDVGQNEAILFRAARMDYANNTTFGGGQTSVTTNPIAVIRKTGLKIQRPKISDLEYTNEWMGYKGLIGQGCRHWYDSLGVKHLHRFPSEMMLRRFILWCLYRTYREEIKMSKSDDSVVVRRMNYMPSFTSPVKWEEKGKDMVTMLYVLAALPVPTQDVRAIPLEESEFLQFCANVYDMYVSFLPSLGGITASGMQILVSDWQYDKMVKSELLEDTTRVRVISYPSTLVIGGLDVEEVFTGQNGPLIEYPTGGPFEIQLSKRPMLMTTEILRKQKIQEDILMLASAYKLTILDGEGDYQVDEVALFDAYARTYGIRKPYSDMMSLILNPEYLSKSNIQTEFAEGVDFDSGLIINGYLYDSPTNYELSTFGDDPKLSLGIPGGELSTRWNSSTLKLLSVLVRSLRIGRTDQDLYDELRNQRSVVILGATDEPLSQKIKNVTRNNWNVTAIGDRAKFPHKTAVSAGVMYTGSADIYISDMNYSSLETSTEGRIAGYKQFIVDEITRMLQASPNLIIIKLQWPSPQLIDQMLPLLPTNYGSVVMSAGASPTLSEELFYIISPLIPTKVTGSVISEFVKRMALQELPLDVEPIKQVSLTDDLFNDNVNPGDFFILTGTKTENNNILSVSSNLSGHVIGGIQTTELGVSSIVHGFVDIVRLNLYQRRNNFLRSLNSLSRPREFVGDLPLSMLEPRMNSSGAVRSYQYVMSYMAGSIMKSYDPDTLLSLGGGQFSEVWWCNGDVKVVDQNITFDPRSVGVAVEKLKITDENLPTLLNDYNGAFSAINSITMQPDDKHIKLIDRIKMLIDYVANSGNPGIISVYHGDYDQIKDLPAIKRFGKIEIKTVDDLPMYYFTFGKYGTVPMLDNAQLSQLTNYAKDPGRKVSLEQIYHPSLLSGAINNKYASIPNASYLTTSHQFSLVLKYYSLRKVTV